MMKCVAIPIPPPVYARFKRLFSKGIFGSGLEAIMEKKPEEVLVIGFGCKLCCVCAFHLFPCVTDDFLVVVDCVSTAVSTKLLLYGVAKQHDSMCKLLFVQRSVTFYCSEEFFFVVAKRSLRRTRLIFEWLHNFELHCGSCSRNPDGSLLQQAIQDFRDYSYWG